MDDPEMEGLKFPAGEVDDRDPGVAQRSVDRQDAHR